MKGEKAACGYPRQLCPIGANFRATDPAAGQHLDSLQPKLIETHFILTEPPAPRVVDGAEHGLCGGGAL